MSSIEKFVIAALLSLLAVSANAQTKIVAVDPEAVIFSTNIAKAKIEKFKANPELLTIKSTADLKMAEIKNLQALEKKDGLTWSKEQRDANIKKLQTLVQDFQIQNKKLEESELAVRQELYKEIAPKFDAALKQIIAAENIAMVVNPRTLVQMDPKLDYTKKVVDLINQTK